MIEVRRATVDDADAAAVFTEVERTDGSGNEEHAPDIRYGWMP